MVHCFDCPPWRPCRATHLSKLSNPFNPPTGVQESTLRRCFHPRSPPFLSGPSLDRHVPILTLVREIRTYEMCSHSFLSVTLDLTWNPSHPEHYTDHQWIGFAVMLTTNLIGLILIVAKSDFVWCVASVWINIAIWTTSPKPRPIIVSVPPIWDRVILNRALQALGILFMVLHPIALAGTLLWKQQLARREGRIRLPT
jgi:hypothetical protein